MIKTLTGTIYKHNYQPSCYNSRPTVPMPGWVTLLEGELHVPKHYDLVKSGNLKLTVRGNGFDDALCLKGVSQYLALPNSFW